MKDTAIRSDSSNRGSAEISQTPSPSRRFTACGSVFPVREHVDSISSMDLLGREKEEKAGDHTESLEATDGS